MKDPPLGLGDIIYKIDLIQKTPVFKDNQALNSNVVYQLPSFLKFDSDFITIEGNKFSEGWSSYNFKVTATIFDTIINNDFLFQVETLVDCSDAKIIPQFNSVIFYLVNTPAIIQKISLTDSKSKQTGISNICGPIHLNLNATYNGTIKQLPTFLQFNQDEIRIKCDDEE